ncbi:MAG: hypothetical protein H6662_16500 [Ardenticatenaceae bacterium]|nr:hypothetical protein [Anaerolineales bacterium]MCB8923189.1 hypothetical protein [Ardenticatenaceae bacterium]MCB9004866.1 hypothetical protein [Ardenticatenaceae bacterium]
MRQVPLQRRQHPIFSPIALLSTLLLAGGLTIALFLTGGRAFNPGDLSTMNFSGAEVGGVMSHADIADNCNQCHAPMQGVDAARCEQCHESVAQQRAAGEGTHGRLPNVERCADCHSEHQGADFDMMQAALDAFDHTTTTFSLAQHARDYDNLPLACDDCHISTHDFSPNPTACDDCHRAADADFMTTHITDFGADCLACHDGHDTMAQMTAVEHAEFFVLAGKHAEAACVGCHTGTDFTGASQECEACHAEPAAHAGLFGTACADCHTPDGWETAVLDGTNFDHARDTRFNLIGHVVNHDGQDFTCRTCHTSTEDFAFSETQCTDCHAVYQADFIIPHAAEMGKNCLNCHDGTGEITNFDHALVWPLEGQHTVIECAACHIDQSFAGTPRECVACHEEPLIHAGLFGTECAACHTAVAWSPAQLTQHTFPLTHGGEGEIDCATCHTNTYTTYTCYNCHEHDPVDIAREHLEEGIGADRLDACVECHPTGEEDRD